MNTEFRILFRPDALIASLAFAFIFVVPGSCDEKVYNAGVKSRTVLQCTKTVVGAYLKYPEAKEPEVTGLEVTIPAGEETGWHTHSVPGYAYVISGELTLVYAGGITKVFKAGEAFAEVVDSEHNGMNKSKKDVVLVAFFTGDRSVPFTKKLQKPSEDKK